MGRRSFAFPSFALPDAAKEGNAGHMFLEAKQLAGFHDTRKDLSRTERMVFTQTLRAHVFDRHRRQKFRLNSQLDQAWALSN